MPEIPQMAEKERRWAQIFDEGSDTGSFASWLEGLTAGLALACPSIASSRPFLCSLIVRKCSPTLRALAALVPAPPATT